GISQRAGKEPRPKTAGQRVNNQTMRMHSPATQPEITASRGRLFVPRTSGKGCTVVIELIPASDPFDVFQSLANLPHVVFFDSALRQPNRACYSFVAADPFLVLQSRRGEIRLFGLENERRLGD